MTADTIEAIIRDMRERKVNHGRNTSPTLTAWADRLEAIAKQQGGEAVAKPSEIIGKARELISDPKRWTTEVYARDSSGESLMDSSSPDAVCWCSLGAIRKVTGQDATAGSLISVRFLSQAVKRKLPAKYNDSHTHAEVLEMFDKAKALAEAEGQ